MKIDPFPGTADAVLEQRLQTLFAEPPLNREPEHVGWWIDEPTGRLGVKFDGRVYYFHADQIGP